MPEITTEFQEILNLMVEKTPFDVGCTERVYYPTIAARTHPSNIHVIMEKFRHLPQIEFWDEEFRVDDKITNSTILYRRK